METAKYKFEGVEFSNISGADLPPDLRDLYIKTSKSMQRSINRNNALKDKRAERIQCCYATILKKGLPDFAVPSSQDLDLRNFKNYQSYRAYISKLEFNFSKYIGFGSVELYAEPLRVAITMFK